MGDARATAQSPRALLRKTSEGSEASLPTRDGKEESRRANHVGRSTAEKSLSRPFVGLPSKKGCYLAVKQVIFGANSEWISQHRSGRASRQGRVPCHVGRA